jgi:hypothetical protein
MNSHDQPQLTTKTSASEVADFATTLRHDPAPMRAVLRTKEADESRTVPDKSPTPVRR